MSENYLPRITREYLDNGAPEGQRNAALFAAACQMRDAGFSESEIHGQLAGRATMDGLGESEAAATIRSALNAPARESLGFANDAKLAKTGATYKLTRPANQDRPRQAQSAAASLRSQVKTTKAANYNLTTSYDFKLPPPLPDGTRQLLKAAFKGGEKIEIVQARAGEDGKEIPDGRGPVMALENWLSKLDQNGGNPNGFLRTADNNGIYICINPLRKDRRDDEVTSFRHALVEFDAIPLEHQLQLIKESKLPCTAIITSGGRSIHAWVKINAKDRAQYDERVRALFEHFAAYEIDPQNKNPSRLCRLAGCARGSGRQELLALNTGAGSFEDWAAGLALEDLGTQYQLDDLVNFKPEEDKSALLGNRWLCKGGSCLWIGQSGIGKSSLAMQQAIYWALARAAFGIQPKRALKSVFIQAENDMGDLAEMFQGVCAELGINKDSEAYQMLRQNLFFYRDTVHTGIEFARVCQRLAEKHKPDFIWGDPLLSYMGDDISQQKVCSQFLRHWLNPISEDTGIVWQFLHHTGKPSKDPNATKHWQQTDLAYMGIGSSELVNWARAVNTITQVEAGVFELNFAKRGQRAGACKLNGEPTRKLYLRHSETGISWLRFDDYTPPARNRKVAPAKDYKGAAALAADWSTKDEVIALAGKFLNLSPNSIENGGGGYWKKIREHLSTDATGKLYKYGA